MSIMRTMRVCSVAALVLIVIAALGPAKWVPRSGLGWQFDHFVGYFGLTLTVCLAWPRPLTVGGALVALAVLLEVLQALTPDRHADIQAATISASGVLAAALSADLFIRAPSGLMQRFWGRWPSWNSARPGLLWLHVWHRNQRHWPR